MEKPFRLSSQINGNYANLMQDEPAKPQSIRDRFPPPWEAVEMPGGMKVQDANWRALTYLYKCDRPGDGRPTLAECRAIAEAICKMVNGD